MIIPPALKIGDKIGIISPAGKIASSDVLPSIEWLKQQGYKVVMGEHVFDQHHLYAGTDKTRAEDLQLMLNDPDIKAIICSRGGYGSLRTWQLLNFEKYFQSPKWIVGFSDITVFHSYLNRKGIASIHGVMPRYFLKEGKTSESLQTLINILEHKTFKYEVDHHPLNRQGSIQGELIGGNLSILYSMRGTELDLNTKGKILFIEDLAEYLYHLDRMMQNFKVGGLFDNLAGIVVGEFTDMMNTMTPFGKNAYEIIADAVEEFNFPVCFGFPAGHVERNLALPFGQTVQLNVEMSCVQLRSID